MSAPVLPAPVSPVEVLLGALNGNPFIIGTAMLLMNLGGRFLSMEMTPGQELFFQNPYIRRALFFIILFMGTRNLAVAAVMWVVVVLSIGYLFNENSAYCIFGKSSIPDTTCSDDKRASVNDADIDNTKIGKKTKPAMTTLPILPIPPLPSSQSSSKLFEMKEDFIPCKDALTPEEQEILTKLTAKAVALYSVAKDPKKIAPVVAAPPSPPVIELPFVEPNQSGPMSSRPGEAAPGWGYGEIPSARIYDLNVGVVRANRL
jgi:hypothetical protein